MKKVMFSPDDVAAMITDLDRNSCDQEALDMLKLRLQMLLHRLQMPLPLR